MDNLSASKPSVVCGTRHAPNAHSLSRSGSLTLVTINSQKAAGTSSWMSPILSRMHLSSRRRCLGGGGGGPGEGCDEGDGGGDWNVAVGCSRAGGGIRGGGGGGTGSTECESRGDAMCTEPAIGVQQLGLHRRRQLNSRVTDDP